VCITIDFYVLLLDTPSSLSPSEQDNSGELHTAEYDYAACLNRLAGCCKNIAAVVQEFQLMPSYVRSDCRPIIRLDELHEAHPYSNRILSEFCDETLSESHVAFSVSSNGSCLFNSASVLLRG
jgi:hypothetical protein